MQTQTRAATPVFRFNLSKDMVDELLQFSKMHQHDDREKYNEAWTLWKRDETVAMLFNNEFERLKLAGYKGNVENVEDKIFKSGRYYFRNKSFIKVPEKKRSKYIPMSKELILAMDNHIKIQYAYDERETRECECRREKKTSMKPSELFIRFYNSHSEMITNEMHRLNAGLGLTEMEMSQNTDVNLNNMKMITKIKKTFKNRIFTFCNHL